MHILEVTLGVSATCHSRSITKDYDNSGSEVSSSSFKGNEHLIDQRFPSPRPSIHRAISAGCFETIFPEV